MYCYCLISLVFVLLVCFGLGFFNLIYEKVLTVFSIEGLLVLVFLTWYIRESLDCFLHQRFVVLATKTIQKKETRTVLLKKVHVSVCLHLNRNNTVSFIFANVCFSYISVHQLNISCETTDYNRSSYLTNNRMTDKAENKELYFFWYTRSQKQRLMKFHLIFIAVLLNVTWLWLCNIHYNSSEAPDSNRCSPKEDLV